MKVWYVKVMAKFSARFSDHSVRAGLVEAEADIRSEIVRLDVHYFGWPMEGALDELREPSVCAERAVLLRACVETLRQEQHP